MTQNRKVIVYIAMSMDGYIAGDHDDISWLGMVEQPGQDYGYAAFIQTIDTVIMGRKTYDKVLTFGIDFPHKDKMCYVITRTPKPQEDNLAFYTGSLQTLVTKLKQETSDKHIFVDGGASVVNALMQENLVDEWVISIIPVALGGGVKLFSDGRPQTALKLINSQAFEKGLVQLHYVKG